MSFSTMDRGVWVFFGVVCGHVHTSVWVSVHMSVSLSPDYLPVLKWRFKPRLCHSTFCGSRTSHGNSVLSSSLSKGDTDSTLFIGLWWEVNEMMHTGDLALSLAQNRCSKYSQHCCPIAQELRRRRTQTLVGGTGHLSSPSCRSSVASLLPFLALLSQLMALFGFNLPAVAPHPSFLAQIEA